MNKADLVEALSQKGGIPSTRARTYVDILLHEMQTALIAGEKVLISDFGAFVVSSRKSFKGRNPRDGSVVTVPSIRIPVFKAGKGLKAALNE